METLNLSKDVARKLRKQAVEGYNYERNHGLNYKAQVKKTKRKILKQNVTRTIGTKRERSKARVRGGNIPPTEIKVDGSIIIAFEETSSGPLWTLPSFTEYDRQIPQPVLQKEFLSAIHEDKSLIKVTTKIKALAPHSFIVSTVVQVPDKN